MAKRLAMTFDGRLTYCSADEHNIGKGRCNHVSHAKNGESQEKFLERTTKVVSILKKKEYDADEWEFGDTIGEDIECLEEQYKNFDPDMYVSSDNVFARMIAAEHGYALDRLAHDKEESVRMTVIQSGYCMDKFLNDTPAVRKTLAQNGFYLDKLINDEDSSVRYAAEMKMNEFDRLVKDDNPVVRLEAAKKGYKLDELAKDNSKWVRAEVAKHKGPFIKELMKDDEAIVREEALKTYIQTQKDEKKLNNLKEALSKKE